MLRCVSLGVVITCFLSLPALGQEYQAAKVDMPAPADAVAPEIAALLSPTGFKVSQGSRVVCEIWLAKEWPIAADAKTSGEVLYPLTPGQFIGVIRYPRKANDFRDQEIPAGLFTVRYGQQPVDGAHVGTSLTRDFFLLLPAAKDRAAAVLDYKALTTMSKETVGASHPAILSLTIAGEGGGLSVREESEKQWVIVHFVGKTKQGSTVKDLPVELVVVGKAAE